MRFAAERSSGSRSAIHLLHCRRATCRARRLLFRRWLQDRPASFEFRNPAVWIMPCMSELKGSLAVICFALRCAMRCSAKESIDAGHSWMEDDSDEPHSLGEKSSNHNQPAASCGESSGRAMRQSSWNYPFDWSVEWLIQPLRSLAPKQKSGYLRQRIPVRAQIRRNDA